MNVSQALAPTLAALETAQTRDIATLKLLKDSIELQGQLALQLLPPPPQVDPTSALGQHIDLFV